MYLRIIDYVVVRTAQKSYLNNFQGEDWQIAPVFWKRYPSGNHQAVRFKSDFVAKLSDCEIK